MVDSVWGKPICKPTISKLATARWVATASTVNIVEDAGLVKSFGLHPTTALTNDLLEWASASDLWSILVSFSWPSYLLYYELFFLWCIVSRASVCREKWFEHIGQCFTCVGPWIVSVHWFVLILKGWTHYIVWGIQNVKYVPVCTIWNW